MKAVLEFTLPEERIEHYQAVHGGEAFSALVNMRQALRNALKWGNLHETAYAAVDSLQQIFFAEVEDLNLDE